MKITVFRCTKSVARAKRARELSSHIFVMIFNNYTSDAGEEKKKKASEETKQQF